MKKHILQILLWLACPLIGRCESIPYFSPGITISWNLQGEFIISPKLSLGIYGDSRFYNITFGRSSGGTGDVYPHYFVEAQIGRLTPPSSFRMAQVFWGGGLGITIPQYQKSNISLRCSAFTGYLVFVNLTTLFVDGIHPDIGAQFVLPIPLTQIDFGSIGG